MNKADFPLVTRLGKQGTDFLGVDYPVISGGMTWISDSNLVKSVGECGGFPVLAAGNMPPELLDQEIKKCNSFNTPYAVNLVTLAPFFQDHKKVVLANEVDFVVFAGNFPRKRDIEEIKTGGSKAISFASTMSIAEQQIRFGADALILEGSEAGGHIGHVSLTILLQQVLFNNPSVPVFVAGGIATGKMIAHLLNMGAAGCQLGTRFVMSQECTAHPAFKQRFVQARAREAVSTPAFDRVRLPVVAVRALHNRGMSEFGTIQLDLLKKLEKSEITREEAQLEVEGYWMGALRNAVKDGDVEHGSLMAGQSVGLMDRVQPMSEIFEELLTDAEAELNRVSALLSAQ